MGFLEKMNNGTHHQGLPGHQGIHFLHQPGKGIPGREGHTEMRPGTTKFRMEEIDHRAHRRDFRTHDIETFIAREAFRPHGTAEGHADILPIDDGHPG